MPVVDRVIRSAGPQDAGPAAAVFARAFAGDPLYLWIFPDERARTGRLLRPRLARCDQDQVPVALVTGEQSNVGYYESLGFAVTGQVELPGGGPGQWTMWRKPLQ